MTNYKIKRTIMGQLPFGSDLLESLTKIVQRENIRIGRIQALGATTHAVVAFYDQNTKSYNPLEFPGGLEILNLTGNISVRDGNPFVHAHILLSDARGNVMGGHLLPGTKLFACEAVIDEFEGEGFVRDHDERTGLHLWKSGYLV
jgi:predicted DNA-binding protein with PD1-like motif